LHTKRNEFHAVSRLLMLAIYDFGYGKLLHNIGYKTKEGIRCFITFWVSHCVIVMKIPYIQD
jgi:hypothetical protein